MILMKDKKQKWISRMVSIFIIIGLKEMTVSEGNIG